MALGVTYDGSISRSTKAFDKSHQKRAKERINVKGMAVDRYTNAIGTQSDNQK